MTTHSAMVAPRQPFSPLSGVRLQQLQSSKNRHSGLVSSYLASDQKPKLSVPAKAPVVLTPSTKRRFSPSEFDDDDFDSENIDPASSLTSSKRSKNNDSTPVKAPSSFHLISAPKFSFTASKTNSITSMAPPSAIPARLQQTPVLRRRANIASPRAPLTAPAGRSPPSMRDNKHRRVSAPFSRVDPPAFLRGSASSALPFSLDAALAGTLTDVSSPKPAPKTSQDGMPKNWFFDIYQDTPEEEAATLMEHSTLTLDLSSDDETSKLNREDKGKENVAPPDYEAPSVSPRNTSPSLASTVGTDKQPITRRKIVKVDDMEDGERTPLSDLETDDFLPAGVTKDDFVVVPPTPAKKEHSTASRPNLFVTERPATLPSVGEADAPVVDREGNAEGEIVIWEDDAKVADEKA